MKIDIEAKKIQNIHKLIVKNTGKNILKINKKFIRKNEVDLTFDKKNFPKEFVIYKGKVKIQSIIKSMIEKINL